MLKDRNDIAKRFILKGLDFLKLGYNLNNDKELEKAIKQVMKCINK